MDFDKKEIGATKVFLISCNRFISFRANIGKQLDYDQKKSFF